MAAAAMSMSAGREMRVNFTLAIASQPHTFLVSRPRQMSRTLLFLSPFTTTVWRNQKFQLCIMPAFYFRRGWQFSDQLSWWVRCCILCTKWPRSPRLDATCSLNQRRPALVDSTGSWTAFGTCTAPSCNKVLLFNIWRKNIDFGLGDSLFI